MCAGAFFFRRVQRRWQAHEEWPRLQASATGRLLRVAYYEDGVALLPLVDLNATGAGMEDWLQVFKDITEAFMSEWERIIGSTKHLTDDEAATGIPGLCGLLEHLEHEIFIKSSSPSSSWAFAYSCTRIAPAAHVRTCSRRPPASRVCAVS